MKTNIIILLIGLFFSSHSNAQDSIQKVPVFDYHNDFNRILKETQNEESDLNYNKLLERFQNNDSTLSNQETLALMIGFTKNQYFKPQLDTLIELEISDLRKKRNYREAITKANQYLKTHPLSYLALKEIAISYYQQSKNFEKEMKLDSSVLFIDSGRYYGIRHSKIFDAMRYSGKGNDPNSPIFSLGLTDGEHFITDAGHKIEQKDVDWNNYGDFIEIISAAKNLEAKLYFFIIQHAKAIIDEEEDKKIKAQKEADKKGSGKKKS
ncbi:MAG: DUF4919 domain-containing protein [Ferruginibacter sp.]|nr:DUF4919 domain-containing protein [Ferruginibacter sp.]